MLCQTSTGREPTCLETIIGIVDCNSAVERRAKNENMLLTYVLKICFSSLTFLFSGFMFIFLLYCFT